jgi:hypothetical protein
MEIKSQYPRIEERIQSVYLSMIEIGSSLTEAEMNKKNKEHFDRILGKQTLSAIPASEELMSISGSEIQTIRDYIDFRTIPDILLEKEQCWPVEPDLKY